MASYSYRLRRALTTLSTVHCHVCLTPTVLSAPTSISSSITAGPFISNPSQFTTILARCFSPFMSSPMSFSSARPSYGNNDEYGGPGLFPGCDYEHWKQRVLLLSSCVQIRLLWEWSDCMRRHVWKHYISAWKRRKREYMLVAQPHTRVFRKKRCCFHIARFINRPAGKGVWREYVDIIAVSELPRLGGGLDMKLVRAR